MYVHAFYQYIQSFQQSTFHDGFQEGPEQTAALSNALLSPHPYLLVAF